MFFRELFALAGESEIKSVSVSVSVKRRTCICRSFFLTMDAVYKPKDKRRNQNKWFDYINFGSPSWTRTNDPAVNSRMLYRLSY